MAYIALYRKWRPKSFEDVVGQRHITETLQKAIDTDKVAHAYLFSGPRGTGKTSTAKIFARAMNCIHGPTSHPCNECDVCRHILSGESLDVVEIDAASNRSIEDIRTLRETIKFMPAEGNKKIYIIDEVHMLTTEAFNALLKTLEEPPQHVIFILATTEPERIPMTILSRCQRYEFRRITSRDIARRLLYVASQEHIDLTEGAAHILAVQADGGMRDALSMLDQCVSNASGTIDEALVRDLLGLIGRDWLFSLSDAVFQGKGAVIIKDIDDVVRMGKEPQVILTEILEHLRALMLYQADPKTDTLAAYADSMKELGTQAKVIQAERLFAMLKILQEALLSAKNSPAPRIAVEMGLLMASRVSHVSSETALPAASSVDGLEDRLTRLEQRVSQLTARLSSAASPAQQAYIPLPDEEDGGAGLPESVPFPEDEYSAAPPMADTRPVSAPALPVRPAVPAAADRPKQSVQPAVSPTVPPSVSVDNAAPVDAGEYQQIWKKMCDILLQEMKKPGVRSCVQHGRVVYLGGGEAIVAYKSNFLAKRANREDYFKFVDAALEQILGSPFHMKGYVEGDAELGEYEKKKSQPCPAAEPAASAAPVVPAAAPADPLPEPHPAPVQREEKPQTPDIVPPQTAEKGPVLKPATVQDMSPEEQAAIGPLLKMVGDCNIYIEDKK